MKTTELPLIAHKHAPQCEMPKGARNAEGVRPLLVSVLTEKGGG